MTGDRAAPSQTIKVLPAWAVVLVVAAVFLLTVGAVAAILLWLDFRGLAGKDRTSAQLDALKIGLSVGLGTGGVFALYLAARRQRTTELDLSQRADAQVSVERDATERRITELYTKAVEQLGSALAVVRLAGLYALERLAQANAEHRQTILDVLCGYLRMPFAVSDTGADDGGPSHDIQELQVRRTAQRILHRHLCPDRPVGDGSSESDPSYWGELDLDLAGATLVRFGLGNTSVRFADFRRARFVGSAQFQGARFSSAIFTDCQFEDLAWFAHTLYAEAGAFDAVRFQGKVTFEDAAFGNAMFRGARFAAEVTFDEARFTHDIDFADAVFNEPASFNASRVRIDDRRTRNLPPEWSVRRARGEEPDRLDTIVPQRWRPRAAVSNDELAMPVTDQEWGFLDRR